MKNNGLKIAVAVVLLLLAGLLIAWNFGLFEGEPAGGTGENNNGEPAGPDGAGTDEGAIGGVGIDKPVR